MPGCHVESVDRDGAGGLAISARGVARAGRCPGCHRPSRSVHSRYRRRLADLPSFAATTTVHLQVRRFYCRNPSCPRRTFAEPLPDLVRPRARRTSRLSQAQSRIGVALGGEGGARLLAHLSMPASAATVLRLVKALPMTTPEAPRRIGVDDWALRKGSTYGTIIVDLDRRRVVDLLPDRSAATLADWLRQRPGIVTVARDRSTEYARGASLGAPEAVQVADRWHLLANVRHVVERWLQTAQTRLRQLPSPSARRRTMRAFRRGAFAPSGAPPPSGLPARQAGLAGGRSTMRCAGAVAPASRCRRSRARCGWRAQRCASTPRPRAFRLAPHMARGRASSTRTCRTWSSAWQRAARTRWRSGARCASGGLPARAGKCTASWPNGARSRSKPEGRPGRRRPSSLSPMRAKFPLPTARQLAWQLVQPVAALDRAAAASVAHVEQDEEARTVAGLARRFTALVRACGVSRERATRDPVADLDGWLTEAKGCGVPAFANFAAGLESDGAAIRAALTDPASSGQAEGQINRLKVIKRQSYGRAGLDLLRRRMILAA